LTLIIIICEHTYQGAYRSWKVMEFKIQILHAWNIMA